MKYYIVSAVVHWLGRFKLKWHSASAVLNTIDMMALRNTVFSVQLTQDWPLDALL